MIFRNITNPLSDFILKNQEHKNVLIVDGVRQVGKTTAIKMVLEKIQTPYLEINLEKEKLTRQALDETKDFAEFERLLKQEYAFVPGAGRVLFIDEANESLRLGHYIRQMKEDWKNQTVILTGSMMLKLFRAKDSRIPVGRYDFLTVRPFSFSEFLLANEMTPSALQKFGLNDFITTGLEKITEREHGLLLQLINHYLTSGGVPAITLAYLESSGQISVAKLILNYLENLRDDFLKIFSAEYSNLFDRTLTAVANLLGQPFKKTAVVQNNNKLADNLLSIFENWKMVLKIEQKSPQPTTSNALHPKRYLFDVGIAKLKREAGFPSIDILSTLNAAGREPLGGLIEQFVVAELLTHWPDVCGFRDKTYEIDFVIKSSGAAIPIECKASLKTNSHHYKALDIYQRNYGNKLAVVISLAPFKRVKRQGYEVIHLPAYAAERLKDYV